MKLLIFLLILCVRSDFVLGDNGAFTSYVNLEKLYTIEDELISLTDVILNQERNIHDDKNVQDIDNVTSIVENAKKAHAGSFNTKTLMTYINNPINVFQLTKRLSTGWREVVTRLEESEKCPKLMRKKLKNIAHNIPTEEQRDNVAKSILRLQAIYNISAEDMMAGKFLDEQTDARLTPGDAIDIVRIASTGQHHAVITEWIHVLLAKYSKDDSFDKITALNMLSSAYYKLGRITKAVAALDELLKLDPDNTGAIRNKQFLQGRQDTNTGPQGTALRRSKRERLLFEHCGGNVEPNVTKQSRLFCTYLPERGQGMFIKPEIRTEVLSMKPLILLFHGMTTASQQSAIKHLGYETMRDLLLKNGYKYFVGVASVKVKDYTQWHWVPKVEEQLKSIPLSHRSPSDRGLLVRNVGMDGHENDELSPYEKKERLGTFIIFLSEVKHYGGDVVFPSANVKVTAEKGSVLFYDSRVHEQATICPVVLDTEWVGIYPLYNAMVQTTCAARRFQRPRRQ